MNVGENLNGSLAVTDPDRFHASQYFFVFNGWSGARETFCRV